jgi:hypothetical protein
MERVILGGGRIERCGEESCFDHRNARAAMQREFRSGSGKIRNVVRLHFLLVRLGQVQFQG